MCVVHVVLSLSSLSRFLTNLSVCSDPECISLFLEIHFQELYPRKSFQCKPQKRHFKKIFWCRKKMGNIFFSNSLYIKEVERMYINAKKSSHLSFLFAKIYSIFCKGSFFCIKKSKSETKKRSGKANKKINTVKKLEILKNL